MSQTEEEKQPQRKRKRLDMLKRLRNGCERERSEEGCTLELNHPRLWLVPCSRSPPKPLPRHQCLYLVLDDWEKGYSIHRVDEDEFDYDSEAGLDPRPAGRPLVRIAAQHAPSSWSFVAHGTKIVAMHAAAFSSGIPAFDTETLGVTVYPTPENRMGIGARNIVHASVGGKLLAFVFRYLHVLGPEPPPTDKSWSWTTVEPPLPLHSNHVSSYAVHPDGRTVFVSIEQWRDNTSSIGTRNSTFALDAERLEWTHLGEWLLPFIGRAHYDRELDALVGICRFDGGGASGRLCCCDVPAPAAGTMPAWKLGKDVFFDTNSMAHSKATLVYMGDSRFCVVEGRVPDDTDLRHRVVAMTSCVLKYDKDGELVTTQYRAYASISYRSAHPQPNTGLDPMAFWM